jgi:hypothetical protein
MPSKFNIFRACIYGQHSYHDVYCGLGSLCSRRSLDMDSDLPGYCSPLPESAGHHRSQ